MGVSVGIGEQPLRSLVILYLDYKCIYIIFEFFIPSDKNLINVGYLYNYVINHSPFFSNFKKTVYFLAEIEISQTEAIG